MRRLGRIGRAAVLPLAVAGLALRAAPARAQAATDEARTARYLESVRGQTPLVTAFLRDMPKGGDLHLHLSGAVYAESYLGWAAESGLCVSPRTTYLSPAPCDSAAGQVPAARALASSSLYGQLVDAWSMRNWNPAQRSGHDQFFDTFGKFGAATEGRTGDMLAEVASRAAMGHVSYLELMQTPDGGGVAALGRQAGWDADFGRMRQKLLDAGLRDTLVKAGAALAAAETRERELLRCGSAGQDPGCAVGVRWIYQVSRARSPEQVFAQILGGFEMASTDPRVVGLNLVQPEDALIAMRDFSLHMRMIDYLHRLYPSVKVALHAGELAPGLVPPAGLRFHIRESVELGHASRIGHGVDVMNEDRPYDLLREMASRGVMVEIALTSNLTILGVSGREHPLAAYRRYGVPVALATDDEGVARSEMSMEYLRAVLDQGLGYRDLKEMARTSLEHAFVQGASAWREGGAFVPVAACAPAGGGWAGDACA
ncbi:MAG: adenosine deaminase, partial [Gemmatimonadetes bacterium]|nr:adenosine deaminase [Gemmatimonadota bacterium]